MPTAWLPGNESLMPARLSNLGWAPRAALLAMLLPLLVECGPARNEFPPACPGTAILGNAADYNAYRPGSPGRDLIDLVLHARIVGVRGSCSEGDRKNQLAVTLNVVVELTRGPAMPGRETDVPIFVAVTDGDKILDKYVYLMHAVFPSNVDRVTLTPGDTTIVLPVGNARSGADYTIVAGFQLAPNETPPPGPRG
ncbi:MAG TPA: hypothetical protein VH855_05325 [Acetobacteraceae bacterium]|jgi:hypothetical protein